MGIVVQIAFGRANFSNTLVKYASMKVSAPFQRVTASSSGRKVGSTTEIRPGRYELNGAIIINSVEHEPGTVLSIQASWFRSGVATRDAAIFLRLRPQAAEWLIRAKVPTTYDNVCGDSFVMFQGPADIMTADELRLLGIIPSKNFVDRFMSLEEVDECFVITRLRDEVVSRPAIQAVFTPEGVEMREIAQAPRRRLRLRGGA